MRIELECCGKSNQCIMPCRKPVPLCWQVHPKGKAKKGQAMNCACGGGTTADGHRLKCQCQPDVEQPAGHFSCLWGMELRVLAPDFRKVEVWESTLNSQTHNSRAGEELKQLRYKIPERVSFAVATDRIHNHSSPMQFLTCKASRCCSQPVF